MEKSNRDNIVLLFDYFNLGSRDLLTSFLNAGYQVKAVCINDEGFLPDNVENVFEYLDLEVNDDVFDNLIKKYQLESSNHLVDLLYESLIFENNKRQD